jgi:hypothetical protein
MFRFIFFLFLILPFSLFSQIEYGNEWIEYNRQYYYFPVVNSGLHQLSYETIDAAGVPISTIPINDFRIFGKEKEIPLRIVDGGDASFDPGDYIEFIAESNDGWLDSLLYSEEDHIGNPGYSLYNDTLMYYFTWDNGGSERYLIETDVNFNLYTPAPFVMQKSIANFNDQYYGGFSQFNSYSSFFVAGEGWGSPNYNGANGFSLPITMNTPSPYTNTNAPNALFHAKSMANSNADFTGQGNHHLRWEIGSSNTLLYDEVFIGYRQTAVDEVFSSNLLNDGNTTVTFQIIGDQGATTDFQSVQYIEIEYPRTLDLANANNAKFKIINSSSEAKVRLDLSNTNFTNPLCYVQGGGVDRFIPLIENGGVWQALIPNSSNGGEQDVLIFSENSANVIGEINPINGNGFFTDFSTFNFEESYIMIYPNLLENGVNQYASYRSSLQGGAYNTLTILANELYHQFGGGVLKHALGIKRFTNYAYNMSTEKPLALLLVGKGIREATEPNTSTGLGTRKSQTAYSNSLIPSFGYPSSDICFTNRYNNDQNWEPNIPVGRVAARNDAELLAYLNKLQIYESNQNQNDIYNKPTKEWQKRVLHFGGGDNTNEQITFQAYLNNYKSTIQGADFGGNVVSFFKDNSNPFNPVLSEEVNELLQDGVSLMTFFGHASATGFDQNLDDPENWGNIGKYPMVIGNSCYTGDIFQPNNNSASEDFVLTPDLGSIGFISSTKLGFSSFLNLYTRELYQQMSPKNYGLPFGEQVKNTIAEVEGSATNFLLETTVQQMTLHGDPLLKLNWHSLPEIDLTEEDIFFEPSQFDLTTDSVEMNVILTNLGKSVTDTFSLNIRRIFPFSSVDSLYTIQVQGLDFKDTFRLMLPIQTDIGLGVNTFNVQADIPSFVSEIYDESGNNEVSTELFIDIDGITPVLPYNYAVVPKDSVVLKASTINPIASYNTYRFEIDTTDLFNSPFRKYAMVEGLGGVKKVLPDEWLNVNSNLNEELQLQDSMVYFWRVAIDSTAPMWVEHSFQYIEGKEGWGQDHFFQFKNGSFTGVGYDRSIRNRTFEPLNRLLECEVHDNANSFTSYAETLWKLNSQIMESNICSTAPSIHVAVIDPSTMEPWGSFNNGQNIDNQFGNVNNGPACRNRVENYFIFRQNSINQLQALDNMIANEVPEGHYLLIYTARFAQYDNWQSLYPNLFSTMQTLGSDSIQPGRDNRAFIFFTQKGTPSSTVEVYAQFPNEFISLSATLEGLANQGVERSTIIGPAAEWETIYWKQNPLENSTFDQTRLSIKALDASKAVQFTIDTSFTLNDSILNLNNLIPANQYPYLQLEASYSDSIDLTPAQVDRWHVLYQTLPEAAIDGSSSYVFYSAEQLPINEGQEVSFAVDVKNISHLPMDSLLVHYWVVNQGQNKIVLDYERQDSLRVGATLRDTVSFETNGMAGQNVLWMEVNPFLQGSNQTEKDQPELAHFNNILQLPFSVEADDVNPILDVTFDGMHILNGDIVNPQSEIVITLKDDNPFLIMNQDMDTSLFGIFLTDPSGNQKRIPFIDGEGDQVLQWIPANEDNLKFKIIYSAQFEDEGTYELLVQGADKSGNLSGDIEYHIKFDVILSSSITKMMNYPNPFSTQTKFVFTLTGSQVPDELMIQIMTVTGRLVKTITQDELGLIRIGRNITDYAWNGRDDFGDQLANGVYLYKVTALINGEPIEQRSSGADQHFKKNWGKMYLMR